MQNFANERHELAANKTTAAAATSLYEDLQAHDLLSKSAYARLTSLIKADKSSSSSSSSSKHVDVDIKDVYLALERLKSNQERDKSRVTSANKSATTTSNNEYSTIGDNTATTGCADEMMSSAHALKLLHHYVDLLCMTSSDTDDVIKKADVTSKAEDGDDRPAVENNVYEELD